MSKLPKISIVKVCLGPIIKYSDIEGQFKYMTTKKSWVKFLYTPPGDEDGEIEKRKIVVPKGFLTDGSSGGPDWGCSWLFHDYLYASHSADGHWYTREEADQLMYEILSFERHTGYKYLFKFALWLNPFYAFSRAWEKSGERGVVLHKYLLERVNLERE